MVGTSCHWQFRRWLAKACILVKQPSMRPAMTCVLYLSASYSCKALPLGLQEITAHCSLGVLFNYIQFSSLSDHNSMAATAAAAVLAGRINRLDGSIALSDCGGVMLQPAPLLACQIHSGLQAEVRGFSKDKVQQRASLRGTACTSIATPRLCHEQALRAGRKVYPPAIMR